MALRYKIVVIDDDATIRSDLSALENSPECEVFAFGNLQDGMEKLKEDPGISGLVLDAECKLTDESETSLTFLPEALKQVDALIRSRDRDICIVINTTHLDQVAPLYGDMYPINKKEEPLALFASLKEGIDDLERTYIQRKFSDAIEQINTIFDDSEKGESLVSVLRNMKREDPNTIESSLNKIRVLSESLVNKICGSTKMPEGLSHRSKIHYLRNKEVRDRHGGHHQLRHEVIPKYIEHIAVSLWGLGSAASHDSADGIHCTKYSVQGSTYLLLEIIHWVGEWIEQ